MNICIADVKDWEIPLFRKALKGHRLTLMKEAITPKNAGSAKKADILSVFVSSNITKDVLKKMPKLKLIATRSTGFDHIDVKECKKKKIAVCNVPVYGDNTVAEHTFALILGLARKLVQSAERTRTGNFSIEGLQGVDLKGKTIGVIGTGKIGRNVVSIAQGFQMNVVAYDVYKDKAYAKKSGITYVSLNKLLAMSDIITVHTPLTPQTRYLINKRNIRRIKRGALLINTARGPVVQTDALIYALKKGILDGAGLDVLEEECEMKEELELLTEEFAKKCDLKTLLEQHMLLTMGNVLVTPHNAFNTKEAVHRITHTTIDNIHRFVKGTPANVVR